MRISVRRETMKRALGWTMVLGLGAALATGCVSRQEEGAKQVGRPDTPIQQKYKSPSASEAESGMGGSGAENPNPADTGAYTFSPPQPVPRERRPAPLGVGAGTDSARTMALEQLKSY
jgi:hypothetical protein